MPFYLGIAKLFEIQNHNHRRLSDIKSNDPVDEFNIFAIISGVIGIVGTGLFVLSRFKVIRRLNPCKGSMAKVPAAIAQAPQAITDEIVLDVKDVSKVFGVIRTKCALAHVAFKVQKRECFGLLGVSGAGKTTAFNIITDQVIPTGGSVYLDGVDKRKNLILAQVHGYKNVKGVVTMLIEMVDMQEHGGKRFNTCSGGQKRRLSVAAALLPRKSPFVILDEATAGIDPVARRDVWSVLSVVREHSAILMSSHSMEECDALCNRISILRDGQIAAAGSSQELKFSLGNFYILSLTLSTMANKALIKNTVVHHFPGATMQKGSFNRNMKWKLPRRPSDLWSNVFARSQTIASTIRATDFCVTQPSLQDIFLIIATHTENENPNGTGKSPTK